MKSKKPLNSPSVGKIRSANSQSSNNANANANANVKVIGKASSLVLQKKSRTGDGSYGNGVKGGSFGIGWWP